MENQIDFELVNNLLNLAKETTEKAKKPSSPMLTRAKSFLKNQISEHVAEYASKLKFAALDLLGKKSGNMKESDTETSQIPLIINCIVSLLKDVISKINDQGELVTNLIDKISQLVDPSETLEAEFNKKHEQLEAEMKEKSDSFEKEMREKKDALEKQMEVKCQKLEINCDEARQRGLKGNLIVSSPDRTTNGQVYTRAVKEKVWDNNRNALRDENDLELAVRMVGLKTGVYIPHRDVYACHPIGKKENHSYILCIGNRQPGSAWDDLTYGMRTGKNRDGGYFTKENIFVNYQLTARRIQLSKEVRKAKTDNLLQKYSIDANGKIYIKQLG